MTGRSESTFGKYLGSLYHLSLTVLKEVHKNKHANANRIEKTLGFHDYSNAYVKGSLLLKGIPTGLGVREKAEEWNWGGEGPIVSAQSWSSKSHFFQLKHTSFSPLDNLLVWGRCTYTGLRTWAMGAWLWWIPSFDIWLDDSLFHSMPQSHLPSGARTQGYIYISHWNSLKWASKEAPSENLENLRAMAQVTITN